MRKGVFVIVTIVVLMMMTATGCSTKGDGDADSVDTTQTDSDTTQTTAVDSIIAATPVPKAADMLFDDFVFNFAANRKMQMERIMFPLTMTENGKERKVESRQWRMDHLFMHQQFYTIVAGSRGELKCAKDTSIKVVMVEQLCYARKEVKQYSFRRIDGLWRLAQLRIMPMSKHRDAGFLEFYYKFVTDNNFQQTALADEIAFSGPDPEDDLSSMDGTLMPEQWPAFAPGMPDDFETFINGEGIFSITYGESHKSNNVRIVDIRGIANGMELEYTFRKTDKGWVLVKCVS